MEFLVEFEVNVPDSASVGDVVARYSAEASVATRLVDEGHLVRLWNQPAVRGEIETLGRYRADSDPELTGLLADLPLYNWMQIIVVPLETHPNDPVSQASVCAAARSQS
jgi:muconolactone delta-isomerase